MSQVLQWQWHDCRIELIHVYWNKEAFKKRRNPVCYMIKIGSKCLGTYFFHVNLPSIFSDLKQLVNKYNLIKKKICKYFIFGCTYIFFLTEFDKGSLISWSVFVNRSIVFTKSLQTDRPHNFISYKTAASYMVAGTHDPTASQTKTQTNRPTDRPTTTVRTLGGIAPAAIIPSKFITSITINSRENYLWYATIDGAL